MINPEGYDFYFASPFFNEDQVEREEALKQILRDKGYKVFSPKENIHLPHDATLEDQEKCFRDNLDGIDASYAVFAVTDEKDMGTIWEAGYAFGQDKPVIYFCETLPIGSYFNLMLARSGISVFMSRQELIECDDVLAAREYKGYIE